MTGVERSSAELSILYGSQTGNAEYLAYEISQAAEEAGINVELIALNDALREEQVRWNRLLIVTSTHDNGHMPDNAQAFWDWLQTLPDDYYAGLPYTVLSIGDSMYDDFCKAGLDFDQKFQDLGAVRYKETIECDVDYDMTSQKWVESFLEEIKTIPEWDDTSAAGESIDLDTENITFEEPEQDFEAVIKSKKILSKPDSNKKVIHYEIGFEDGFIYQPGDSVDIFPKNSKALVKEWLAAFPNTETVKINDEEHSFEDALTNILELRLPHFALAIDLAEAVSDTPIAKEVLEFFEAGNRTVILKWLWNRDVLDIVKEIEAFDLGAQAIVDKLRPIQKRSYSIASSPSKHKNEVHFTVGNIEFERDERKYKGCASSFLDELSVSKEKFKIKRLQAHDFKLPDSDAPIIMIGPGVGVAPFIGFLHDLEAKQKNNKTWLFFGDQYRSKDWIYEEEMQSWLDSGVLNKLSLAFSRDQEEKYYVQDEIKKNAAEFKKWVDSGAYIFVCGDKEYMAHDVETALIDIFGEQKVEELKKSLRYVKDVY